MAVTVESPGASVGALVTVAFLKAQLDAGSDHIEMFMPLLLDVISRLPLSTFTVEDVQLALSSIHNVSMPKHVVATLLRRAEKAYITRNISVYKRNPKVEFPISSVDAKKEQIERGQHRLAESLISHAIRRKLVIPSVDIALEMLFGFLEFEQIALLLETPTRGVQIPRLDQRNRAIIAEFIEYIVQYDRALLAVLRAMLEGLVLYHAAFLPDLSSAKRRFRNLRVMFDSPLLRQALGYEGPALKSLLREATDVMKASGIECAVFDDSLEEIRRLLAMYEAHLGTEHGRAQLKSSPMTRYFLTQRYSPSEMIELSTFLQRDIAAAGFNILSRPARENDYTAGEKDLMERLKRPNTGAEHNIEPRIIHDVECIAGVLTLRRGRRSNILEDAGVIFATDSSSVIKSVQAWWHENEKETSVAPIVHIRTLTNLAWLKRPALCGDFKIQELVVLCAAALHPQPATWDRFLRHLSKLQQTNRITSDESAAILVSNMLDRTLKTAEFESDDPDNIEVATLDEAVERVIASYTADAARMIHIAETDNAAKIADAEERVLRAIERADAAERSAAESARNRNLKIQVRSRKWAHRLTAAIQWVGNIVLLVGALSLISERHFHPGLVGISIACIIIFIILEFIALKRHISELLCKLEEFLYDKFLMLFGIDD